VNDSQGLEDTQPTPSVSARVAAVEHAVAGISDGISSMQAQLGELHASHAELMDYVSVASGDRVSAMRDASQARAWTRAVGAGAAVWMFDAVAPVVSQVLAKWMHGG
jgi:hypothetical protein